MDLGPRLGSLRWAAPRFGPVEYALLAAFVVLTVGVATGVGVQTLDDHALRALPSAEEPGGRHPLAQVSYLLVLCASPEISIAVTLAVAGLWSWWCHSALPLSRVAPPVLLGAFLVVVLKLLVGRPGPPSSDPVTLLGYFPSGHTATALLCAGALAAALAEQRPRLRVPAIAVSVTWTAAMGAALLYQRFHWVSDVVGALLLCALVLRLRLRASG